MIVAPITLFVLASYAAVMYPYNRVWGGVIRPTTYILLPLALWLALVNTLYNAIVATFVFWDWPREWFTSDRMRRYVYDAPPAPYGTQRYVVSLNYWDKEHI